MAISYDNSAQSTQFSAGPNTCTFSYANAGNYLFVNANAGSVTYNGVSMSILQSFTPTGSPFGANCPIITVWGLANPPVGTFNIVATVGTQIDVTCISYFGVDPGTQPEGSSTNDAHAGQVTGMNTSVSSVSNGDWIVGFIRSANNTPNNFVAQSGTTLRQGGTGLLGIEACGIADLNSSKTPGSYTVGFDFSAGSGFTTLLVFAITRPTTGNNNFLIMFP